MLTANDPLPCVPQRVLIAGVTGSGKTTLAGRLAACWEIPHIEIDGLFHGPGWTARPQFLDDVRAFAAAPRWVTEWQYLSKGTLPILTPRAQLAIWLDYPYHLVRARLLRRTLMRSLLRTRLWNGNREKPAWYLLKRNPEQNLLRWQSKTLHAWSERMPRIQAEFPQLPIVRLRSPAETEHWLRMQRR